MIDLLLNESLIRSLFPWFAAVTPVLAILLFFIGVGRTKRKSKAAAASGLESEGPPPSEGSGYAEEASGAADPGARRGRALLLILGLLGPGVWLAWIAYEAIMDRFGFASVKGLLIVLGVFVLAGLVLGWAVGRYAGRAQGTR